MSATVTKKLWSRMAETNVFSSVYKTLLSRLKAPRSRSSPSALRLLTHADSNPNAHVNNNNNNNSADEKDSPKNNQKVPVTLPNASKGVAVSFIQTENGKPVETDNGVDREATSGDKKESTLSSGGYLGNVFSYFFPPVVKKPAVQTDGKQTVSEKETSPKVAIGRLSRAEMEQRTVGIAKKLLAAESTASLILRTQEFSAHLLNYPQAKNAVIVNKKVVPKLIERLRQSNEDDLQLQMRECLSLIGVVRPPRGRGIRILSIDGGGTRGMMGLEVLEALEKACAGVRICDLFDYIVGVSTGAILAYLLTSKQYTVRHTRHIYMDISKELFSQSRVYGYSGLLISHSYYNTKKWVEILKRIAGEENTLIETSRLANSPKLGIVACVMNSAQLRPYIFRNYECPSGRDSHYDGGSGHRLWQALQATAAAPGYFEEVVLDNALVLQDGGILINNPTAVGIHEAKLLWPHSHIQCVVSIGNGRSLTLPTVGHPRKSSTRVTLTSLQEKITKIVDSATDTELVHTTLRDLLPPTDYFRFNPYMSHEYTLDEINAAKLSQMQDDARLYVRRNEPKIITAALRLVQKRSLLQKLADRLRLEATVRLGYYRP